MSRAATNAFRAPAIRRSATSSGTAFPGQLIRYRQSQLPYCHNLNVNVHHNAFRRTTPLGDELFSATPSGAGGVAFCTGSDNYKFQNNWVCATDTGDGGGVGHLGFGYNGDIEHNTVIFNQSTNPTIPTNGGGIRIRARRRDPLRHGDRDCGLPPNTIAPER